MARRRGTPEQVTRFDAAFRALSECTETESREGIRHETQEFRRALAKANALSRPLSFWQRSTAAAYHRLNKQYKQENRAERQQRREQRRKARVQDPARQARATRRRQRAVPSQRTSQKRTGR